MLCAPAVHFKIAIERENVACLKLCGQMDQARIGQVDVLIPISSYNALNRRCATGKLNRNLERAVDDVLKNRLGGSRKASRQVTSFCDNRFAGD